MNKTTTNSGEKRITSYYRDVYSRDNFIYKRFRNFIVAFGGLMQIVPAVFLRKNMGERYYSKTWVRFWMFLLMILPVPYMHLEHLLLHFGNHMYFSPKQEITWVRFGTWYLFIFIFGYFGRLRRKEIKFSRSSFDPTKFSWYTGDFWPNIEKLGFQYSILQKLMTNNPNKEWTLRQIPTLVEPIIICSIGFALWMLEQKIGGVLFIIGLFYGWSYHMAFRNGDDAMLDILDEIKIARALSNSIDNPHQKLDSDDQIIGRFPASPEDRKGVINAVLGVDGNGIPDAI